MDTNLLAALIQGMVDQRGHHPQIQTWGLVMAAFLTALPPTIAAIMAYNKAASVEVSSIVNRAIAVDTNQINKEQVSNLKEIHKAVTAQKEQTEKIAEHVKEELDTKSAVNDRKLNTIHELVNSDMGKRLTELAAAHDLIARLDPTPSNQDQAKATHLLLALHMKKQSGVDSNFSNGFEGQFKSDSSSGSS